MGPEVFFRPAFIAFSRLVLWLDGQRLLQSGIKDTQVACVRIASGTQGIPVHVFDILCHLLCFSCATHATTVKCLLTDTTGRRTTLVSGHLNVVPRESGKFDCILTSIPCACGFHKQSDNKVTSCALLQIIDGPLL